MEDVADFSAADFKPVKTQDFTPVSPVSNKTSFEPVNANSFTPITNQREHKESFPNPVSTPHQYDSIMIHSAKQYGIDVNLLRSVGIQETGLGTGSNYDSKNGIDKDGNRGRGLFQLDPASGATPDSLQKAGTDNRFASDTAAKMLKDNLKKTGGNVRAALAMYNAGNPESAQGLAYADQVIARMKNLDPVEDNSVFGRLKKDIKTTQRIAANGKPIEKALGQTSEGRKISKFEGDLQSNWDYLKNHPALAGIDSLGSFQRSVGAVADAAEKHEDFKGYVNSVVDAVFHPTDQNIARTTESIRKLPVLNKLPSHQEIDNYINSHVANEFRPYAEAIVKGGEDTLLQTVSDPLTFLGGGITKAGIVAATKTAEAASKIANASGIGRYFSHLKAGSQIGDALKDLFVERRDLDKAGFTEKGKKVRIALENSVLADEGRNAARDAKAVGNADETEKRIVEYAHRHGTLSVANQASAHPSIVTGKNPNPTGSAVIGNLPNAISELRKMIPEERLQYLNNLRKDITRNEIARKSQLIFSKNPDLHKGNITNWHAISTGNGYKINVGNNKFDLTGMANLTGSLRRLGKAAVFANPLPHGAKNVGQLAYMAGGLPAVMKGLASMIRGVDPITIERLEQMGASASYVDKQYKGPFAGYLKAMDGVLSHLEHGWRAGLLDEIDRKLGPSYPNSVEEYLKGHLINSKIGDYRNQAAFVKMFEALGGPFVAFRLGIVPKNVLQTLKDNPQRIEQLYRVPENIQRNRSYKGKHANNINVGGPGEDAAKGVVDPKGYISSPSTLGVLGSLTKSSDQTWLEQLVKLGESYIPGFSDVEHLGQIANGSAMSGQHMSLTDKVADFIFDLVGGYLSREKTQKQLNQERRKEEKRGI